MKKKIFGVGSFDADYIVQVKERVNGKQIVVWTCPYYRKWSNMLKRCYYKAYQERQVTYVDCSVCEDWLTFSKFKAWMEVQEWEGKQLDKDILFPGNKVYSPETCVFVDSKVNSFIIERGNDRGPYPIGVSFNQRVKKFAAHCSFNSIQECLGYFENANDAHLAWCKRKQELALVLLKDVEDDRIVQAIKQRYF